MLLFLRSIMILVFDWLLLFFIFRTKTISINNDRYITHVLLCMLFVFDTIVTLSLLYFSENCVGRTQRNVVVLVQSILQLNRSPFPPPSLYILSFAFVCIYIHIYIYTNNNSSLYITLVFYSFAIACVADGVEKKSGIDKRLSIHSMIRIITLRTTSIM